MKRENFTEWELSYDNYIKEDEGLREVLTTLGNGYLGTRGACALMRMTEYHYPGTYIAGVYDKLGTLMSGRIIYNEDLVNIQNWLLVEIKIGRGKFINPFEEKLISYNQKLDIKNGILYKEILFEDKTGRRTLIETERFVSMASMHLMGIKISVTPQNYEDKIIFRSLIDGNIINWGVPRYRKLNSKHLVPESCGHYGKNCNYVVVRTKQSKIDIAVCAVNEVEIAGKKIVSNLYKVLKGKKVSGYDLAYVAKEGKTLTLKKTVAVYTSRDEGVKKPLVSAKKELKLAPVYNALRSRHINAWKKLWNSFDIQVGGDIFSQMVLRLHAFHLLQSASPHNVKIDAGITARGLHGEAYRGHVFWDELFVMPFYDFHMPVISKALLMYRYKRLDAARRYAEENGYEGAMFPWQSGSSGVEETQVVHLNPLSGKWDPDYSCIQRHVSFAIAYNVYEYWLRTGDDKFMENEGGELFLSIAKFAASLAKYDKKDDRYHTENLMGPDEFHEKMPDSDEPGLKDNAYTNLLISWVLAEGINILKRVKNKKRLMKKASISEFDISKWANISEKMNLIIEDDIISQFDGYFELKELDWDYYRKKYGNIHRMDRILKAEGKSPDYYKVAKQADALMIFYLFPLDKIEEIFTRLGYKFTKNMLRKNYDYYVKRTSHGSTLSKVVHCYIAHILGDEKEAWKWYREVLVSDIHDIQGGTTPEGIHSGVMASSINIVMRAFAGLEMYEGKIVVSPRIPKDWSEINFNFIFRGVRFNYSLNRSKLAIKAIGRLKKCIDFYVNGKVYKLSESKPGFSVKVK